MKLSVLKKDKMYMLMLPKKISGNYWIQDVDSYGNPRNLINLEEKNEKWILKSNDVVTIYVDNKPVKETPLLENTFYALKIEGDTYYSFLYGETITNQEFLYYRVNTSVITIGSTEDCDIVYKNSLLGKTKVTINFEKGKKSIHASESFYKIYVNGLSLQDKQLEIGDHIFIFGLHIVLFENTIAMNKIGGVLLREGKLVLESLPEITVTEREDIKIAELEPFVRMPRFRTKIEDKKIKIDDPPMKEKEDDTPYFMVIGPMLTMSMMSVTTIFSSLSPVLSGEREFSSSIPMLLVGIAMLASMLIWPIITRNYNRKMQRKREAERQEKYRQYLHQKEYEIEMEISKQKQIIIENRIPLDECVRVIQNKKRNLWEREIIHDDFLELRVGIGNRKPNIDIIYSEEKFTLEEDDLKQKLYEIIEKNKEITDVPVTFNLREKNISAVIGKTMMTTDFMYGLLLQMITFHSFNDLKIVILSNGKTKEKWNMFKNSSYLWNESRMIRFFSTNKDEAHALSSYLDEEFKRRKENNDKKNNLYTPYYVILTDCYPEMKDLSIISDVLNSEENMGFSILIQNDRLSNLPNECSFFININEQNSVLFENELVQEKQKIFKEELLNKKVLEECISLINHIPARKDENAFQLMNSLDFLEMYEVGKIEQLNVLSRWRTNNPMISLSSPIGVDETGEILKLDLHEKAHGPHGLIAGMTGSGKSEFIITYILSMAINYHPDEVQFVLIDYKGGGLVGAFLNNEIGMKLPHLAGTITNLDTAEISRALSSIESELKRRQDLFNKAREKLNEGVIDIYKYQKFYREGLLETPLSHLFIICDEFAELKSDQPDFMDELISTARIGRSLGVHLILATQKPSGVVNDQIWSNSRFRVCLKVQEASDSNEVIKRPDAAYLKEAGRFYLQVGFNEYFTKGQSAYAGNPYVPKDEMYKELDESIDFVGNIGENIKTIEDTKKSQTVSKGQELSNIVSYLDELADKENIKVKSLWLEKLKSILYLDEIREKYHYEKKDFSLEFVLGIYDNPKLQRQDLLTIDLLSKGNLVIYSMEEKNTIMNTMIYSLITTYTAEEVNLYVLDFDSQTLKIYENAPQVGDVVFSSEYEKISKLFNQISEEIEIRKNLFADYNGSFDYYIKHGGKIPAKVIMVHGYENFKETYEKEDMILEKIVREGFKYGIFVILTAINERTLKLNMRASFPQIIPLKMPTPIDYNMLLNKKAPVIANTPGRGVVLIEDEPYEFQTATICEAEKMMDYINEKINVLNSTQSVKASSIRVLPKVVTWDLIKNENVTLKNIPIGMNAENLQISTFDFTKNTINLISSIDYSYLSSFTKVLIENMLKYENFDVMVIDDKGIYQNSEVITSKDFTFMDKEIFNKKREKELVIFVTGIENFMNNLPDDVKKDVNAYFEKVSKLKNCYFVFVERVEGLKPFAYEKWFKGYIDTDDSIWIGRGLNNSTVHHLVTPLREISAVIAPNFGYNIKGGVATRIKIIEDVK